MDMDEAAPYFRDAPVGLDESAGLLREAFVDPDETAEYFRPSALEQSLIDVDETVEYFHPINPGMFDTIDPQIFSQVQPQTQVELDQWYNYANPPNVQSPFQPSRPMNALLQPIQTPKPMSHPQMVQMGFSEPQQTNVGSQSEEAPFLGNYEDSIESRLMQAMIGVPSEDFTHEIQDQGQIQGQVQGCPICWHPSCICQK